MHRTFASRARVEAPPRQALDGRASAEFDGDVASWSPEHLVLASLGVCMLTTFEAFAARDRIEIARWDATIDGTVERTPDGLMFTSIVMGIDIEIAGDIARVAATLEDAKQCCLVLNSLRVPVVLEPQIRTTDGIAIELPCTLPVDEESQALAH